VCALAALVGSGCKDIIDSIGGDDEMPCVTTADCGGGQICNAGTCGDPGTGGLQDPCWASRDCMDGLYCSPLGTCAPAGTGMEGATCSTDGDCASGLRCDLAGFVGVCAAGGSGEPGASCAENADCLPGLYCGVDAVCAGLFEAFPPFAGVTCEPPEGPFRVYFEVPRPGVPPKDFYRLPFPNDARVDASGTLDMTGFPDPGPTPLGVNLAKLYVDALVEDFEGFGSTAIVQFRFAGKLDFDSTYDDIKFVDLGTGGEIGLSWSWTSARNKYICENRLQVRNNVHSPLLPKHTYAVVLLTGITGEGGGPAAAQDADFAAVMSDTRPTGDEALGRAWDVYAPLRAWAAAKNIPVSSIAGATVFTVQDTTGHMQRLADNVAQQPAPVLSQLTLCDTGVTSPCDDGTGERACPAADPAFYEIHGKMTVPVYQEGTAPYLAPEQGGGIVEMMGVPQVQRTEEVCFALTIPKGGAMPAGGWPLVVYHHGTGGSMRSFVNEGVAAQVATSAAPAAALSFDAVEHGARRGGSTESPDNLVFNALNPRAARDNFLQGGVDILQALRVGGLPAFDVTGVGSIDFDDTRVAFFGHSQGATSGELAMAFSDAAPLVVFSGAGAWLTASLLEKTSPVNIKAGMQFLFGEPGDGFNADHPVMTVFQTYFERSDPINYVPLILRAPPAGVASKHVYMSYGTGDTFTPRSTLQNNARALGLPPVVPILSGEDYDVSPVSRPVETNVVAGDGQQRTAMCVQYEHGDYDGHFVSTRHAGALADWTALLTSWIQTGTPALP
jgi:predicted esterase